MIPLLQKKTADTAHMESLQVTQGLPDFWAGPGDEAISEQHPVRVKGHVKTMLIHGRHLAHDLSARLGHACVATLANKPAWSVCAKTKFEAGLS